MEKLSIIFSSLFVIWFILFEKHIETKTISFHESYPDEEATTSDDGFTVIENATDITDELTTEYETLVHSDGKKKMDKPESPSDDVISLNVGGQILKTFRSTLTAVPNSKLALLFTKDNKNKIMSTTKQEPVYFFDYNPVLFEYLLDQLREIKRTPQIPAHEINFIAPQIDVQFNFSNMLFDLGLNADRFLLPLVGTHLDLKVSSLIGWKECYRGKYNEPFDATILTTTCAGKRLLVACRPTSNKTTLTVAGIGKREDLFNRCTPNHYCSTQMKNGTGFYYAETQAWGFAGRPKDFSPTYNPYNHQYYSGAQGQFLLNPCDSSNEYPQYRLCWSLRSDVGRGGGDRCGNSMNLHNTKGWERLIYQTV